MIEQASNSGAHAVKLQTANPDKAYLKTSPSYKVFQGSQLSKEDTSKMFEYAKRLKIEGSTRILDDFQAKMPDLALFWRRLVCAA